MKLNTKTKNVLSIIGTIFSIASLISLWLFYENYLKWAGLFNSDGRYFDENESVVYLSQDFILIVPTILFFAIALIVFWIRRRYSINDNLCRKLICEIRFPWSLVNCKENILLQSELKREIGPMHVLWKQKPIVFARNESNDDILVRVKMNGIAYVHLTWSGKVDQFPDNYPFCEIFESEIDASLWLKNEITNYEN